MFLPEIPDFELPFKKTFKCPVCKNDIAAQTLIRIALSRPDVIMEVMA